MEPTISARQLHEDSGMKKPWPQFVNAIKDVVPEWESCRATWTKAKQGVRPAFDYLLNQEQADAVLEACNTRKKRTTAFVEDDDLPAGLLDAVIAATEPTEVPVPTGSLHFLPRTHICEPCDTAGEDEEPSFASMLREAAIRVEQMENSFNRMSEDLSIADAKNKRLGIAIKERDCQIENLRKELEELKTNPPRPVWGRRNKTTGCER